MSKAFLPLLIVFCGAMIVLLQFGFIFLLLALLPSVVAYYYDINRDPYKSTFKTVFCCNLAATLPSLVPMLEAGIKLRRYDTSTILNDWNNWLIVYSGAAAGWCLIVLCRYVARFSVTLFNEYNIAMLENQQQRLIEEWGQQIKHPPGTMR